MRDFLPLHIGVRLGHLARGRVTEGPVIAVGSPLSPKIGWARAEIQ
jgi:hypothetical protein